MRNNDVIGRKLFRSAFRIELSINDGRVEHDDQSRRLRAAIPQQISGFDDLQGQLWFALKNWPIWNWETKIMTNFDQFWAEKPKLLPMLTWKSPRNQGFWPIWSENQNYYQFWPEKSKLWSILTWKTKIITNSDLKIKVFDQYWPENQDYDQFWPEKPRFYQFRS